MNEHIETIDQVKSTVIDLAIKFGPKSSSPSSS